MDYLIVIVKLLLKLIFFFFFFNFFPSLPLPLLTLFVTSFMLVFNYTSVLIEELYNGLGPLFVNNRQARVKITMRWGQALHSENTSVTKLVQYQIQYLVLGTSRVFCPMFREKRTRVIFYELAILMLQPIWISLSWKGVLFEW